MSDLRICVHDPSLLSIYQDAVRVFRSKIGSPNRDSGFDLYVPEKFVTQYGSTHTLDHGVSCSVTDTYGCSEPYYMYPRSSISKTPLRVANCVGIIDSGYRGHLIGKLDNIKPHETEYVVEKHSRLFQLCSHNLLPFETIKIVEELNETARGAGGFGSTGV